MKALPTLGLVQSAKVCGAGKWVVMGITLNVPPFTTLSNGYVVDAVQLEKSLQVIKYSPLWHDFYESWVAREKAWNSFSNDEIPLTVYNFHNGIYTGLRQAMITIFGWNSFIDFINVFEDKKGIRIE